MTNTIKTTCLTSKDRIILAFGYRIGVGGFVGFIIGILMGGGING